MTQSFPLKSVRFTAQTADLLPWYEDYAEAENIAVNAALLRALVAHRRAVERARERARLRNLTHLPKENTA
jgi:hypothetical protein